MFKALSVFVVLLLAFGTHAKVRSVWVKTRNVINSYSLDKLEHDDYLPLWFLGQNKLVPANYNKAADPELFCKVIYHWTFNQARGWRGFSTLFTRDFAWNWAQAQKYAMWAHDWTSFAKEGLAQDPSFTDVACYDPIKFMNIIPTGTCGEFSALMQGVYESMGFQVRRFVLGGGYHSVSEVYYNGAWHHYDFDQAGWCMDPTNDHVMSLAEWAANPTHVVNTYNAALDTVNYPNSTRPVYFENADMPGWATKEPTIWPGAQKTSESYAHHDSYENFHDMSFALREGEYIKFNWDAQYHTWPGLGLYGATYVDSNYDRWMSDGQMVYEPTLSNSYNDYYDGLYQDSSMNLVADGLVPIGSSGYAIWAFHSAYQMAVCTLTTTSIGTITKAISKDMGATWTTFTGTNPGNIKELYDFLLKITVASGAKLTGLKSVINIVHNPGALPRLSVVNPLQGRSTPAWNDYMDTVRVYQYDQDEVLTKKANQAIDAVTTVDAPQYGKITSISGTYTYAVPNPPPGNYQVGLFMGTGSIPGTMVAESDNFDTPPNNWVYSYVDHWRGVLSKQRYSLADGAKKASMRLSRTAVTGGVTSGTVHAKIRMHYWVNHSTRTELDSLIISYAVKAVNAATTDPAIIPPSMGPEIVYSCTTGTFTNGHWDSHGFNLQPAVGAVGLKNIWMKIVNPGQKPFAPRDTTGGGGPVAPCIFPSGNTLSAELNGGGGTNINNYRAQFSEQIGQNLRRVHSCHWDTTWNRYRVATFGNSITNQNTYWLDLNNAIVNIPNAAAINTFLDSTARQNNWMINSKNAAHGNESGQSIGWVNSVVSSVLANDRPMIATIMIGTNNCANGAPLEWGNCNYPGPGCSCDPCWPDTLEYREILQQLTDAGVMPIVQLIPPFDGSQLVGWKYLRDSLIVPYNNKVKALCQSRNIPYIDMYQWAVDHGGISLLSDWAHPRSCGSGGNDFSDGCLAGGTSGLQNARNYLTIMAINDITRYVVNGEGFLYTNAGRLAAVDDIMSLDCFPNPFNPSATIRFHTPASSGAQRVVIGIYNVKGVMVKSFATSSPSGSLVWDGRDMNGKNVTSGMYFYRLIVGDKSLQGKMVLAK
ncbi:MAG: hypothetical protein A2519_11575 [Candidatus Raymondbacteria bacterium RIFOXYD12_FULL_49_13]|uniref:SGNH hydrolase-type esterase domain-containing protein n=1 Tax=Candidatus Raymondbacteria bacterium RIFOXYD12_FULL_49_13 TaxID=1817890 RepID=A0A1F7FKA5_UNCRA|nr:MAG: hypothetical protein A2519_11575 [Candidatus Raymondbacteria bacterium RIFOXYD12_FULL_49_13]